MKVMIGDMLSQEEIDALLKGDDDSSYDSQDYNNYSFDNMLTDYEKDTLGEIGNISMGTSATTLFTLLGQKVVITTPEVSMTNVEELAMQYPIPFIAVNVKYKRGLEGTNLLILKADDVKVITDIMMGGNGKLTDSEINEMDMSAISEAMNQMVGSSSTSLSEMFLNKIDIDPPRAFQVNFHKGEWDFEIFESQEPIVKISFKMVVGDIIDSEIMQLIPYNFAKTMVNKLSFLKEVENSTNNSQPQINQPSLMKEELNPSMGNRNPMSNNDYQDHQDHSNLESVTNLNIANNEYQDNLTKPQELKQESVNVKKVQFESFDNNQNSMYNESIERIQEIPVEITVELGRTVRKISEILEYGPGTIIELDKLVGEPLEIYANGKYIARGEVVVIDDNFGVRVTDIINPSKRISKL